MTTAQPSDAALLSNLGFLRRLAWSLTREDATADDLAQDAALIALERRPDEMRSPRAWLSRVVRNLAFNAHRGAERRKRHEVAAPQPAPVPTPEQHAARREMLEAVVSEVVLLEEPFGTAVIMRFYDELSPKEIAKRLGLPEGTVRSRLSRGLAMLRERLDSRVGPRDHWVTVLAPAALWSGGAIGTGAKAAVAAVAAILVLAPLAIWTFGNREQERTEGSGDRRAGSAAPAAASSADRGPGGTEVAAAPAPAPIAPRPATSEQDARPASDDPVPEPIRGVVVDAETRAPIAGAEIAWMVVDPPPVERVAGGLRYRSSFWESSTSDQALVFQGRRLTSGPDGAFEIPGTPARVLMVAKHGDRWGTFRGAATSIPTIRLSVDRSDWIEVKDQDGQPRSGVPVAIWRLGGPESLPEWHGVTGPDGRAEVRHAQQLRPDGKRTGLAYGVDVFGEKPVEDATTTGPATVRLTLPRTAALRVSVRSGAARAGGARVTIRARRAASQDEPGGLTGIVGPLGDVEFPFVAPMTEMAIEASDPILGIAHASQFVVTSQPGGSVATVILLGEGGRSLRAIDESTGKPLAGRKLFRLDQDSSVDGDPPFFSTDAEGRAWIPAGEVGSMELGSPNDLQVRWLVAHVDVPSGADIGDVALRIAPVLAAGRVKTADGAPAAGVTVRGEREDPAARGTRMGWMTHQALAVARTSTDGRFVLRGLARGKPLRVVAGSGGPSSNAGVRCEEGATGVEVVLARPRGRERISGIRGSIVVDRGVPLELLRAALSPKLERGMQFVTARAPLREVPGGNDAATRRAEFAFSGVEPGAYTFELQSVGGSDPVTTATFETSTSVSSFGSFGGFDGGVPVFQGPELEVTAASAGDSGLENIDVRDRLRVVKARVADRAGKPVAGAEATVLTSETPARKVGGGVTDAQGRVVIVTSQGPHRIAVRASGYRSGVEPLADGEQAIALRPGIPIRIVARPAGAASEGLSALVEWTSKPAARFSLMSDEETAIARLANDGRVGFVDLEGTLVLSAPGDYRVMFTSEPAPAAPGQIPFVMQSANAGEVIHVKDSDAEQAFEIVVKPPSPGSRRSVR